MVVTSKTKHYTEKTLKVQPRTSNEGSEGEQKYSSTLSLTSALDGGVGSQRHTPAALPPGKETLYPLYRRLSGPQGRYGRVRKISPPPGFDPRTLQPVASRYTDWAIPSHIQRNHTNTKCYSHRTVKVSNRSVNDLPVVIEIRWNGSPGIQTQWIAISNSDRS
jgi:hypothetical protein